MHTAEQAGGSRRASSSLSLLLLARAGDETPTNELCARYLPRLRRWAHGRIPGWARAGVDTEDVVQDTLLKSVRNLNQLTIEHDRAFHAYLYEALQNRLRDAVRRAQRKPSGVELSDQAPASGPSPLELAVGRQTLERYESALARLHTSDREVLVARVELGLSYAEIVELLGKTSVGATRVAVSRALVRLAREMQHERAS